MPAPALYHFKCTNGAPMGRRSTPAHDERLYLHHLPLDSGGYDAGGAYWGFRPYGIRLYRYVNAEGDREGFIDAKDREDAKRQLRDEYECVSFYR